MRLETQIEYEEQTWECVYLNGDSRLNRETKNEILWNIIDMYKKGAGKRKLKTNDFEGTIELRKRTYLSNFSGTYFKAEGDFETGKIDLGVLLLDRLDPKLN